MKREIMTFSPDRAVSREALRRRIFLGLFAALAVALHTMEALLPSPAPWFRLGFANIFTLTALFLFGGRAAWSVAFTRIGVGSLFLGNLFAPGFFLSLSGGTLATLLMITAKKLGGKNIGPVGVSAVGAAGHATGQMIVARWLLVQHPGVWLLYPYFLLFALATGVFNGFIADYLIEILNRHPAFQKSQNESPPPFSSCSNSPPRS